MRPDPGGAEELPIHAQGRIFLVGADRRRNPSSRGPIAPWHGIPSEAVDVNHGQLLGRRLEDVAVIVNLHELAPVGGRATSWRDRRRFEWFTQVGENLADRPRFGDEGDQPDVAATRRALERKLLPHPGYQFRPGNP